MPKENSHSAIASGVIEVKYALNVSSEKILDHQFPGIPTFRYGRLRTPARSIMDQMSFHVKGHKPSALPKKLVFPLWCRLLIAALGAALAWWGSFPRSPANFGYLNWRGQPVFPSSVVPIGAVLILVSLVPASWIERAFQRWVG